MRDDDGLLLPLLLLGGLVAYFVLAPDPFGILASWGAEGRAQGQAAEQYLQAHQTFTM